MDANVQEEELKERYARVSGYMRDASQAGDRHTARVLESLLTGIARTLDGIAEARARHDAELTGMAELVGISKTPDDVAEARSRHQAEVSRMIEVYERCVLSAVDRS